MRRFILFLLAGSVASAGDVSYVVLNRSDTNSLVRVSDDGKSITTIANGAGGYGLAVDQNGDYIVAAVSRLLRVTRSGRVSVIAQTPLGSQWMAVAIDFQGDFILTDNRQHAVWRVSATNGVATKVANYPVVNQQHELEDSGVLVDPSGDYLVIEDNHVIEVDHIRKSTDATGFFSIAPSGEVHAILIRGDQIPRGAHISQDGLGGYFVTGSNSLFRLSRAGESKRIATFPVGPLSSVARNPETGEILVVSLSVPLIMKVKAEGSAVQPLMMESAQLPSPTAIIVDPHVANR
jgi:hypothetical protein